MRTQKVNPARQPSVVHSSLPSGLYRGKLQEVAFDSNINRVHLQFTIPNPCGVITRAFEAATYKNSRLVEFSQGLVSPIPIPHGASVEDVLSLLSDIRGNEFMLAYTALPGRHALGALSAVPLHRGVRHDLTTGQGGTLARAV